MDLAALGRPIEPRLPKRRPRLDGLGQPWRDRTPERAKRARQGLFSDGNALAKGGARAGSAPAPGAARMNNWYLAEVTRPSLLMRLAGTRRDCRSRSSRLAPRVTANANSTFARLAETVEPRPLCGTAIRESTDLNTTHHGWEIQSGVVYRGWPRGTPTGRGVGGPWQLPEIGWPRCDGALGTPRVPRCLRRSQEWRRLSSCEPDRSAPSAKERQRLCIVFTHGVVLTGAA